MRRPWRGADAAAWAALGALALLAALLLATHQGRALSYAFPVLALAAGLATLRARGELYVGLVCWLWFLTPALRRAIDWQIGWNDMNPVMLAPLAVTALCALDLRGDASGPRPSQAPYWLAGCGLLYGFCLGLYTAGVLAAAYDLLGYIAPVLFGAWLVRRPSQLAARRGALMAHFVAGLGLLGAYGIAQYVLAPPWDVYWMENAPINTIGQPRPFEIRVFGTLNAPQPFAMVLMAGLLAALARPGRWGWLAAPVGLAAFGLSLVRSAWGGWLVGLAVLLVCAERRVKLTLAAIAVVGALLAVPAALVFAEAEPVLERVQTLAELGSDQSLNDRLNLYAGFAEAAALGGVGQGLGAIGLGAKLSENAELIDFDSGLMAMLIMLGWPGSLLYALGVGLLSVRAWAGRADGAFGAAAVAVVGAIASQLMFSNVLNGVAGLTFWAFLALGAGPAPTWSPAKRAAPTRRIA